VSHKSFDNLSGVRGFAAAIVLFSHVIQIHFLRFIGLNTPLHQVSSIASEYAVVVFFILSGYLITHTLESNIQRNGELRFDEYVAARIARLYPPFLFAIGISLVVYLLMEVFVLPGRSGPLSLPGDLYAAREMVHLSARETWQAIFMLQGMLEINGPLWSLYMEAKLYVLYACALALIGPRSLVQKLILLVVFYYVSKAGLRLNPHFAGYATVWLIGSMAYYMWSECAERRSRMLMCAALIFSAETLHLVKDGISPLFAGRDLLIAAFISWLLFKRRITTPSPQWLADCSYSLYVTHFPVLLLAQSLLIYFGSVSIGVALSTALASASVAIAIALIGRAIEAKKTTVQSELLKFFEYLRCLTFKSS
jgi:peptidoglycan/LPS O-acetylase OafA/YrhL